MLPTHYYRMLFQQGALFSYPTEAVWGLGCNPWDEDAVHRLLALKQRPVSKGLILVAGEWALLAPLLSHLTADQQRTLKASWPGPITWLIPRPAGVPDWIVGDFDTLAVRWSAHPTVGALTRAIGAPIVSTSANRSGRRPARYGFQVRQWLGHYVDQVVPGVVGGASQPSTIRDLVSGRTLR